MGTAADTGSESADDPPAPAPAPAPQTRRRWHRTLARCSLHLIVSMVVTWPLTANLPDSLPTGTEDAATVAYFNLWTLRWNEQRITGGLDGYWDAPIFHPTQGAFALSEPQPLTGAAYTAFHAVVRDQTVAYNLLLLAVLTLNGLAAARLSRRAGASEAAAVVAGVFAQALPFVATQLGVLQLTMLFPPIMLMDALLAWFDRPRLRGAATVGAWLAATFLTCTYFGLFACVTVAPAALVLLRRRHLTARSLLSLAVAVGVAAALTLPLVLPIGEHTATYSRALDSVHGGSALPADYLFIDRRAIGADVTLWANRLGSTSRALYPGTPLLFLALVGAWSVARSSGSTARRAAVFCAVIAASGFVISCCPPLPMSTAASRWLGMWCEAGRAHGVGGGGRGVATRW